MHLQTCKEASLQKICMKGLSGKQVDKGVQRSNTMSHTRRLKDYSSYSAKENGSVDGLIQSSSRVHAG